MIAGTAGMLLFIAFVVLLFNRLTRLRLSARNAWANTDVQLKKRYDLLPGLVEIVKAYASHEAETLERLTKMRSVAMQASGPGEKGMREGVLMTTVKGLLAVVENYPDLKADRHFDELMEKLTEVEGDLEFSRRIYNSAVLAYNVAIQVFPSNLVADAFNFASLDFFELEADGPERMTVRVELSRTSKK